MQVVIKFDGSLSEKTSGACFEVVAKDQEHAEQIVQWLYSKTMDKSRTYIDSYIILDPQSVKIDLLKKN